MERSVFILGDLLYLAVQLGGGGLIDAAGVLQAAEAHSLQHAQHAGGIDIGCELRHIEADLHMALGGQIVDLIRAHGADNREDAHRIAQIAVVQVEVGVTLQMGDALTVINGGAADNAVDIVALLKQKLCQIAAVLTGNTGDQCFFHNAVSLSSVSCAVILRAFFLCVCYSTALFFFFAGRILQKTSIILTFLVYWVCSAEM